jgi:hypothetical protein
MRGIHGRFGTMAEVAYRAAADSATLVAAAGEVAREHGVCPNRQSKVLSLEYGKLKRLTTESRPAKRRTARLSAPLAESDEMVEPCAPRPTSGLSGLAGACVASRASMRWYRVRGP